MRVVGFKELHWHDNPDGPSLAAAVRLAAGEDDVRVLAYLRGGMVFAARPMVVPDFLRSEREMASLSHWHTDGEWAWPTDLAYYVEVYHAALPQEFVAHMASADWDCPQLSREQVAGVSEWLVRTRWSKDAEPGAAPDPAA